VKKKLQNGKRRSKSDSAEDREDERVGAAVEDLEFDKGVVEHIESVTSLIEGRGMSRDEVLEMLRRVMRQHSLVRERRIDYVVRFLKENSP
jgi:hypothetical protein